MCLRRFVSFGGGCYIILCRESGAKEKACHYGEFCEMCSDPEESLYHVILNCPVAKRFWAEVKKTAGVSIPKLHPLHMGDKYPSFGYLVP